MPNPDNLERHIDALAQWILQSHHLVAFTGAGISTDSGIPDYRGPNGVWTRRDQGLPAPKWAVPESEVMPNASHFALVELHRLGKLKFLISQNIDNLHRACGMRPESLAELHGNRSLMRCVDCDQQYTLKEVEWDQDRYGPGYRTQRYVPGQPDCPSCSGRLISSIVNFDDPMPAKEMQIATQHAQQSDLMLAMGSSLLVEPAASLIGLSLKSAARLVLINQGHTPYDHAATLRICASINDVFPPAVTRVKHALERRPP